MVIPYEVSQHFDRKSGMGSFELMAVELDEQGRFKGLGALGQFHYSHDCDYPQLRAQAEKDTVRHYEAILRQEQTRSRR